MRIDDIEIENFKKFQRQVVDLHPRFTLLVGDNGTGKTTILDAMAVALGIWHKAAPRGVRRSILADEIRLEPRQAGDRVVFHPWLPCRIVTRGSIGATEGLSWQRTIREGGTRTINVRAGDAEKAIAALMKAAEGHAAALPVLAYYGAGRACLPRRKRPSRTASPRKRQQLDAYDNCLDVPIHDRDINDWFLYEAASNGQGRPGYIVVKQAILNCIPGADDVRFDSDLKEIVLSIGGSEQPYYNLSAGQRMMLAMVADIAIKAVTLNSYLLGPGCARARDPMLLLQQTSGVVLIDELDLHLHPKWQRRTAADLKRTFPAIQFVCTSHSPQIIGELSPAEIRILDDNRAVMPPRSQGIDSSRILEELMGAAPRSHAVAELIDGLSRSIDREEFNEAHQLLLRLEAALGPDDPEVTRARTLMSFLEAKA